MFTETLCLLSKLSMSMLAPHAKWAFARISMSKLPFADSNSPLSLTCCQSEPPNGKLNFCRIWHQIATKVLLCSLSFGGHQGIIWARSGGDVWVKKRFCYTLYGSPSYLPLIYNIAENQIAVHETTAWQKCVSLVGDLVVDHVQSCKFGVTWVSLRKQLWLCYDDVVMMGKRNYQLCLHPKIIETLTETVLHNPLNCCFYSPGFKNVIQKNKKMLLRFPHSCFPEHKKLGSMWGLWDENSHQNLSIQIDAVHSPRFKGALGKLSSSRPLGVSSMQANSWWQEKEAGVCAPISFLSIPSSVGDSA